MNFGFSTGCFYMFMEPISLKAINICQNFKFNIIELNACTLERINLLKDIRKEDLQDFEYVSVHAPDHDVMSKLDSRGHKKVFDILEDAYKRLKFNSLVLHPGEWIVDWEIFNNYTLPIAFENNDWRHKIGADVKSLKEILKNKNFKLVLDINHCYTNDSSMELTKEIYNNFKNKVTHYHLSGIENYKEPHVPLYRSQGKKLTDNIPNKDIPIIIESVFTDLKDAQKEIDFLRKNIK